MEHDTRLHSAEVPKMFAAFGAFGRGERDLPNLDVGTGDFSIIFVAIFREK